MAKWQERIIVRKTPNYFMEAVELMDDYFRWKTEREKEGDQDSTWEEEHLVTHLDNFIIPASEIDELYHDVYGFISDCKHGAKPILDPLWELQPYFTVKAQEHTEEMPGFLKAALVMSDIHSVRELSREEFITCCLIGIHELSNDWQIGNFEIGSIEEQALYEKLGNPNFDMGEILEIITHTPLTDGEQIMLLRFFRDIDTYYEKVKNALLQIEMVCRQNYGAVKKRFELKVQDLETGEGKTYYKNLIEGAKWHIEDYRSEENIHMEVGIIAYGSLSVRFSSWNRLRLRIIPGLLFSELSKLEDKEKYRSKMAQKQLKAISEPTRYKIIRELSIRPQYVQELADAIGLTTATLSHHLAHLQQVMLVGVNIEGRRSYYSLNSEELLELSKVLYNMAQTSRMED